jgi:diguanylate cyclase (GGDEF)-like protein
MAEHHTTRLNKDPTVLSGFSRTLPEIQWLLLCLVLFYIAVGEVVSEDKPILVIGSVVYASLNLLFQYVNFFKEPKDWKLTIQSWVMILYISFIIWHTGKIESPLVNLYLLPVVASAITLSRLTTLLGTTLIGVAIFYFHTAVNENYSFISLSGGSQWLMVFFPLLLVAYVITMLSSDIQKGFNLLKTASETDDLTKLFNRRSLLSLGKKLIRMADRTNKPLSVLMIDVDKLKPVNDRHGHEAGNLLLISISQNISSVLREHDVAARYGGDEFVVLLPECPVESAQKVVERMIKCFEQHSMRYQGEDIELSASFGIAEYPTDGDDLETLIEKADTAMYISKKEGRNLIQIYQHS